MEDIQKAKKDLDKKEEKVIDEAKDTIEKIAKKFKKEEKQIGKELIKATNHLIHKILKMNINNHFLCFFILSSNLF